MSRSLTQKFIINREKYIETRQELTKRYEYQEKIPLLNKQYNNGHVKEPINYVLKSLDHEMLIIHDLYHEHVTRPSFNDDFRHVSLINKTYTDITKKVRICYDKVTLVKNTYVNNKTDFNPTHRLLLQNAVSYIFKRICDISSNLGQQNKKYLDRLKSIHDASKEYFSVEMPQEDLVNEIAISMDQILVSAPNDQSNSFQQITNSVQDINNIVRDLAYMVNEQVTQ
ncbi:hypothetical protein HZS_503 [Henneguya salminicola]|nr:hypothetical protein HZS_503 [Henneguya salminicola]